MTLSRNYFNLLKFKTIISVDPQNPSFLKIVLAGDVRVGKTTLRLRYLGEGFRKKYMSTLGADFAVKKYYNDQIQIWDLAGQQSFRVIVRNYYVGAHGVVLVFDLTRIDTLSGLTNWIDECLDILGELIPIIIVGNKLDLREPGSENITTEFAYDYIKKLSTKYGQNFNYIETSALTGEKIDTAFEFLIQEILNMPEE
ncbi:MAG: Rab family GTPase [Candidatus Kariarchaeaceae archaeon]|jgi:Ras-related protein Rab-1A